MMSPDEALNHLKELREDIDFCRIENYGPHDDKDFMEALTVAIACLEEKCHE